MIDFAKFLGGERKTSAAGEEEKKELVKKLAESEKKLAETEKKHAESEKKHEESEKKRADSEKKHAKSELTNIGLRNKVILFD